MNKIKIATTSDIHNNKWPEFEESDLLVFTGDFTNCSNSDGINQFLQFESVMNDLLKQADKFELIIMVFGNHDSFSGYNPRHKEILKWEKIFKEEKNTKLRFLTNESLKYKGLRFYGNPYTTPKSQLDPTTQEIEKSNPRSANYWTEKTERKTKNVLESLKPDVMLTHSPPRGILDLNKRNVACGETRWKTFLGNKKPKLWIFGHIHEGYGKIEIDGTLYVNATLTNYDKEELNKVQYIEISEKVENE